MNAIRYFAVGLGIAYLAAGIAGFVPGLLSTPSPGDPALTVEAAHGRLLGIFPVNAIHNVIHLAIGAWGLAAFRRADAARVFARGLAIIYGLFTVMGLLPTLNTTFGLAPLHGHDVWLHAISAIAGAYFGWFHRPTVEATSPGFAGSKPRRDS